MAWTNKSRVSPRALRSPNRFRLLDRLVLLHHSHLPSHSPRSSSSTSRAQRPLPLPPALLNTLAAPPSTEVSTFLPSRPQISSETLEPLRQQFIDFSLERYPQIPLLIPIFVGCPESHEAEPGHRFRGAFAWTGHCSRTSTERAVGCALEILPQTAMDARDIAQKTSNGAYMISR